MQNLIKIDFLKLANGKIPFLEWLENLDKEIQLRIRYRISKVEIGNFGNTKALGKGIYEFKFNFHSGYRIYFGQKEKKIIILINGGNKSSQKRDIKKALEYWNYYLQEENINDER